MAGFFKWIRGCFMPVRIEDIDNMHREDVPFWVKSQSIPAAKLPPADQAMADWLEVRYERARYVGAQRPLDQIKGVIIHRLNRGQFDAGVRYVQDPRPRTVSWHATVGDGQICRHVPIDHVAWHCKYPVGTNRTTLGLEIEGPMDTTIPLVTHEAVYRVVSLWKAICPELEYVASHRYMDDKAGKRKPPRRDPGKEFDWSVLEDLGLDLKP